MSFHYENPLFIVLSITGFLCLVISLFFKYYPPKNINHLYGYRTPRSMKNTENWHFAQRYSADQLIYTSMLMIIASAAGLFIDSKSIIWMWIGIVLMCLLFLVVMYKTERALKIFENKKP